MDRKLILPITLLVAGGGVGYYIWRRVTAVPPVMIPGVPGVPTEPGISVGWGRFDLLVPFRGLGDLIGGLWDGGTKPKAQTTVPSTTVVYSTEEVTAAKESFLAGDTLTVRQRAVLASTGYYV